MKAVAVTLLLAACGATDPARQYEFMPNPHTLGRAICLTEKINGQRVGYGVWFIRGDQLRSTMQDVIEAHEKKHIEQINLFRNCALFQKWFELNQADAEAEAHCAALEFEVARGMPHREAMDKYSRWLSRGYRSLQLTQADARGLLGKFC